MRAHRPGWVRKVAISGLLAVVATTSSLILSTGVATAAAPTIVNGGTSSGPGNLPNWIEGNAVSRDSKAGASTQIDDRIFGTLVVKHDEGRTVTAIALDSDWGGTDETATVAPTAVTPSVIPGATSNYSSVRFNFVPPNHPDARTGPTIGVCGGNNSQPSGTIRVRAVLDDGTRTAPVALSNEFQLMEQGCVFVNNPPVIYNQTQTATTINPGASVGFTFQGDDSDAGAGALTSNDAFDKIRWRVRRLNDGAIVSGPSCVDVGGSGGTDNVSVTLNVTFSAALGRGRYVVESEAGGENDTINNTTTTTCQASSINGGGRWFRLGAVDVNGAATATSLSVNSLPAIMQAGTSFNLTATTADTDTNGRIQAIEWDADGTAGFERRVLADEAVGITAADKAQTVSTTVGDCADRTVTVQVTDNGSMNGADANRVQKSTSTSTVVNCAPVADNQGVAVTEDSPQPFTIAPTDGDGDTLTYSVVDAPDHGAITGSFPSFSYNPDPSFNGIDTYTYKVDDGKGASDTAIVTFTVSKVNDQPTADDVSVNTPEDTPIAIDLTTKVSDPDTGDTPPQTLTISIITPPAVGTATVTGPREITYSPPSNFNGVVSLVYQVDDGQAAPNSTDNGSITINVDAVDDAPEADNQTVSTNEDTNLNVTLGGTTDVDGETVTYSVPPPLQPEHGTVTVVGTTATYDPDQDYFGPDEFMFQATDGNSITTGTITITVNPVNDAPVADDQEVSTLEDTALPITLTASDVDNVSTDLVYTVIASPIHGTLDTTNGDHIVYTPDPDYNGPDALTFQVSDGSLTDTASVTITVIPVNDPPVADDQAVTTDEDIPVPILLTASDVDNTQEQLIYTVVVPPASGTLSGTNNDLVYTPNLNFNGTDSFVFQVSDGDLTDEGVVSITVNATNDPPTAIPQVVDTPEDTALPIHLDAVDPDDATSSLTFTVLAGPSHGSLDTTSGQDLTYSPNQDYNGFDAFVFQVEDPSGASDVATVVIRVGEVGTNDPPIGDNQAVTTDEDTPLGITLTGSDVDGDDLTYSIEVGAVDGTTQILNDTVIYSPNLNFHGSDMFMFKVDDGHGGFNFAVVHITVQSVNDAPDAIPATYELLEDTTQPITLTGSDVDGDSLTFAVVTQPSNGTLTGTAPSLVYTPNQDYSGNDSFTFSVDDGHGAVSIGEIALIVDEAPKTVTSLFAESVVASVLSHGTTLRIQIPVTARLTDAATGLGVAGKTIVFTAGNNNPIGPTPLCTAVTDATGKARCTGLLTTVGALLHLGYNAYFAGDADNLAASDTGPVLRILDIKIP